jgi:hypothetical protein|tara:strand:+ start:227 stop:670 length:444 start_codon:yes stop_codon:yes gene_type:complete
MSISTVNFNIPTTQPTDKPVKIYQVENDTNHYGKGLYTGWCKRAFCPTDQVVRCHVHGEGTLTVKEDSKTWEYKGNWVWGKAEGYGECTIWHHEKTAENEKGDISVYKGQWKNSAHEGHGEHIVTNKDGVVTKTEIGLFEKGNFITL